MCRVVGEGKMEWRLTSSGLSAASSAFGPTVLLTRPDGAIEPGEHAESPKVLSVAALRVLVRPARWGEEEECWRVLSVRMERRKSLGFGAI